MRSLLLATVLVSTVVLSAGASNLFIGNDISSPVTIYTSSGTFVQFFGQNSATGTAINSAGDIWTVAPNFGNNSVVEYNSSQTVLNSFVATVNGQWIEDMSHGLGNILYASTFEGNVFTLNDQTGAVISSFAVPGSSYTGVAFDGTHLWASAGLSGQALYEFTTSGTLLLTLPLPFTCGGVGYDVSDGTLWCGDFGQVHHLTTAGVVLGGFTTSASNYHDGLETANLATTGVPEPGTLLLVGTGLAGLFTRLRKRA